MKINDKQSVKLRTGSIRFKNHWKLLAAPFRIYADFESLLKWVQNNDRSNNTTYTKKYQKHNSCSFAHKVVCIDDKFTNQLFEILSCLWKMKEVLNQVTNSGHKTNFLLEKIVK